MQVKKQSKVEKWVMSRNKKIRNGGIYLKGWRKEGKWGIDQGEKRGKRNAWKENRKSEN